MLCPAALASLQRAAYQVNISGFEIGGARVPAPATACTNPKIPTVCPNIVHAGEDRVLISYGPSPAAPVPKGALVSIFACYSNVSSFNRPWRANSTAKNILVRTATASSWCCAYVPAKLATCISKLAEVLTETCNFARTFSQLSTCNMKLLKLCTHWSVAPD